MEQQYSSEKITVLKGLEAVRKRPAMYIGDVGKKGLHHLIWEVVDNSIDEAMAGHCDTIKVVVEKSNIVKISGIDKELVGKVSSEIKILKPVEPYKEKGIMVS